jgi:hypothetical protein
MGLGGVGVVRGVGNGWSQSLGDSPRPFLKEDEGSNLEVDPLNCQETGEQACPCPWLPHEGHRLRWGAGPLIVFTERLRM